MACIMRSHMIPLSAYFGVCTGLGASEVEAWTDCLGLGGLLEFVHFVFGPGRMRALNLTHISVGILIFFHLHLLVRVTCVETS